MIWLILCSLLVLRKQRQDNIVEEEDCVVFTFRTRARKKEMNRLHDFEIFDFSLMKFDFNLIFNRSNSICFFGCCSSFVGRVVRVYVGFTSLH